MLSETDSSSSPLMLVHQYCKQIVSSVPFFMCHHWIEKEKSKLQLFWHLFWHSSLRLQPQNSNSEPRLAPLSLRKCPLGDRHFLFRTIAAASPHSATFEFGAFFYNFITSKTTTPHPRFPPHINIFQSDQNFNEIGSISEGQEGSTSIRCLEWPNNLEREGRKW